MDTHVSSVFHLFILDHRFLDAPTHIIVHSRLPLSVKRCECLFCQETPWEARQCMCGGDDHLACKHPLSSEAFKGLHTVGRYNRFYQEFLSPILLFLEPPYPYRLCLGPIRIPFLHVGASMGLQSQVSSDRFSYLRSSLLYICLELDISLSTSRLPSCKVNRCFLQSFPYTISYLVFSLL